MDDMRGFTIFVCICLIALSCYHFIKTTQLYDENEHLKSELEWYKSLQEPFIDQRDSIAYNIEIRDSIVYNIIDKYEEQKSEVHNMLDSVLVDTFNKLVWSE